MMLAADKIKHLKAGAAVLLWSLLLTGVALLLGLHLASAVIAGAGLTSATTEEGSQWLANRARKRLGLAPERDVSMRDLLAGAAPCLAAALAIEILLRNGVLVLPWAT